MDFDFDMGDTAMFLDEPALPIIEDRHGTPAPQQSSKRAKVRNSSDWLTLPPLAKRYVRPLTKVCKGSSNSLLLVLPLMLQKRIHYPLRGWDRSFPSVRLAQRHLFLACYYRRTMNNR